MGNATVISGSYDTEAECRDAAAQIAGSRTTDPARILEAAVAYAAAQGLAVEDKTAETATKTRNLSRVAAARGTLAFVARTPETEPLFVPHDPVAPEGLPTNVRFIQTPPVAFLVSAAGATLLVPSAEAFTQAAFNTLR